MRQGCDYLFKAVCNSFITAERDDSGSKVKDSLLNDNFIENNKISRIKQAIQMAR
jgi:hypothetical protein